MPNERMPTKKIEENSVWGEGKTEKRNLDTTSSKFFIFTVSRVYGFKIEVYGLLENRVNLED
jgi:hypothetical protein